MRFRVEVGLLILSLAFAVSLFGGLGITIDLGEHRVIDILEASPHRYLEYIQDAFLLLILPPAVGLAFSVVAFIRERKSPTGVLKWWLPLAVFGGFFFFWGTFRLQWTSTNYYEVKQWVELYGPVDIANLILAVYVTASVGHSIWLFAGILFMLSPAFRIMIPNKWKSYKSRKK